MSYTMIVERKPKESLSGRTLGVLLRDFNFGLKLPRAKGGI